MQSEKFMQSFSKLVEEVEIETENDPHAIQPEIYIVFFIFCSLIIGIIFKKLSYQIKIPYTPSIFFFGMIIGTFYERFGFAGKSIALISQVSPHALVQIFLPLLIFEACLELDWYLFKKQFVIIFMYAFPCVLINTILMTLSVKLIAWYPNDSYCWSGAWIFAAIISCTDTPAVLALLKDLGAPKQFQVIIEGESLFNDGTAMVLYTIGVSIYQGQASSPFAVLWLFTTLVFGALILGVLVGFISAYLIKKVFNDEILVIAITVTSGLIAFFIAEFVLCRNGIQVSGIMTVVFLTCFMAAFGNTQIAPETEKAVGDFWRMLVYIDETIIFILGGVIVGAVVIDDKDQYITKTDFWKMIVLYICLNFARGLALFSLYPWYKDSGYKITVPQMYIATYAGIRGAIGIAFSMMAASNPNLDIKLRKLILFDISGCAVLTLLINATTTKMVIQRLGIQIVHPSKVIIFKDLIINIINETNQKAEHLKKNQYLQLTNWNDVQRYSPVQKLFKLVEQLNKKINILLQQWPIKQVEKDVEEEKEEKELEELYYSQKEQQKEEESESGESEGLVDILELNQDEERELQEVRGKFIMCIKSLYKEAFEYYMCGGEAIMALYGSASQDLDCIEEPLQTWDNMQTYFYSEKILSILLWCKNIPIFGRFFRNYLFNELSYQYDIVSTFISVHERIQHISLEFPYQKKYLYQVNDELRANKEKAEKYLMNQLHSSFQEIAREIQTKKAALILLNQQKEYLEEVYSQGQLNDSEKNFIKSQIDSDVLQLQFLTPSWKPMQQKEFFQQIPFFKYLPETFQDQLLQQGVTKTYEKDYVLTREGEMSKSIYIIMRGSVTLYWQKQNSIHKIQRGTGTIVPLISLVAKSKKNQCNIIVDSIITVFELKLKTLQQIVEKNFELQVYI